MTETAIRRALAKACGIEDAHWCADGLLGSKFVGWIGPDDNTGRSVNVPDYPCSLDAMHGLEQIVIDDDNATEWGYQLIKQALPNVTMKTQFTPYHLAFIALLTPKQRAEAMLHTLKLWEE